MMSVYTLESEATIKNEVGTSAVSDECENCGSWIAHWEALSGQDAGKCSVKNCSNDGEVGAHITRPFATNEDYQTHPYIVPMCREHNGKHGQSFTSKKGVTFVWANMQETCGKSS